MFETMHIPLWVLQVAEEYESNSRAEFNVIKYSKTFKETNHEKHQYL